MLLGDIGLLKWVFQKLILTIKTMLSTNLIFIQFTTSRPVPSRYALLGTKMTLTYWLKSCHFKTTSEIVDYLNSNKVANLNFSYAKFLLLLFSH